MKTVFLQKKIQCNDIKALTLFKITFNYLISVVQDLGKFECPLFPCFKCLNASPCFVIKT